MSNASHRGGRPRPPQSDADVIWALADSVSDCLPRGERALLYADVTAREYLTAAERLLRAAVAASHPLPPRTLMLVSDWLERYRGAPEHSWVLRQLLLARRVSETAALGRPDLRTR